MRELAQPVPYTGGAPDDLGFKKRAACGILTFLLCWALCMAHLFVPIGNQQLDLTYRMGVVHSPLLLLLRIMGISYLT